jgi:hypothetical protein
MPTDSCRTRFTRSSELLSELLSELSNLLREEDGAEVWRKAGELRNPEEFRTVEMGW